MELRKITVAVIGALCTAPVFAVSEPTPQIVDRAVHFDHDHEVQHGIEDHKPQYSPQKSLPQTPKPEPTIEDVSPFNALSAGTSALQGPEVLYESR